MNVKKEIICELNKLKDKIPYPSDLSKNINEIINFISNNIVLIDKNVLRELIKFEIVKFLDVNRASISLNLKLDKFFTDKEKEFYLEIYDEDKLEIYLKEKFIDYLENLKEDNIND